MPTATSTTPTHDHATADAADVRTASAAIQVNGMDCASCVSHVEKAAQRLDGVQACDVSLARGRAVVKFDPAQVDPQQIAAAITEAGYPAAAESTDASAGSAEAEHARLHHQMMHARSWFRRALVAMILWLPLEAAHWRFRAAGIHAHGPGGVPWISWMARVSRTVSIGRR